MEGVEKDSSDCQERVGQAGVGQVSQEKGQEGVSQKGAVQEGIIRQWINVLRMTRTRVRVAVAVASKRHFMGSWSICVRRYMVRFQLSPIRI